METLQKMTASPLQLAAGLVLGSLGLVWMWHRIARQRRRALLRDKVVLITGASSGLGEACAHAFYRSGSKVILCARRFNELERVKSDLTSLKLTPPNPHPPCVLCLDLEDLGGIPAKAQEALALHGQVDILINNGGLSYRGTVMGTDMAVHQKLMTVNYFGAVALTKALLPSMVAKKSGHIVAVSSLQGKIALPYRSAYGASKHALNAFCDSLRAETAKDHIQVTVLNPGYIRTNLSYNAIKSDGSKHGEMDRTIATGMTPEYIAELLMDAILNGEVEVAPAAFLHRQAVTLRYLSPRLYSWVMAMRARTNDC